MAFEKILNYILGVNEENISDFNFLADQCSGQRNFNFITEKLNYKSIVINNPGNWDKLNPPSLNLNDGAMDIIDEYISSTHPTREVDFLDHSDMDFYLKDILKLPNIITKNIPRSEEQILRGDFTKEKLDKNLPSYQEILQLQNIQIQLKTFGFDEGGVSSLHQESAVLFYQKILNCNDRVSLLLKYGYVPVFDKKFGPLQDIPGFYFENNKSSLENDQFTREKISQWIQEGVVHEVGECPKGVSPLTVVSKLDNTTGEVKKRLCLDLSRSINPMLSDLSTRMDTFIDL